MRGDEDAAEPGRSDIWSRSFAGGGVGGGFSRGGEMSGGRLVAQIIGGALGLVLAASPVHAAPKKQLEKDRRTVVRFDDDTIQGDLTRPDGDLVWSRPRLDLPSLVAPPASFDRAAHRTLLAAADTASNRVGDLNSTHSSEPTRDADGTTGGRAHGETHGETGARAPSRTGTAADR